MLSIFVTFVWKGTLTFVPQYPFFNFQPLEGRVASPQCLVTQFCHMHHTCCTPVARTSAPVWVQLTCEQHVVFGPLCNRPVCLHVCPQCASRRGPRWHCSTGCGPKQSARAIYTWRAATFTPAPSSGAPFTSTCVSLRQPEDYQRLYKGFKKSFKWYRRRSAGVECDLIARHFVLMSSLFVANWTHAYV